MEGKLLDQRLACSFSPIKITIAITILFRESHINVSVQEKLYVVDEKKVHFTDSFAQIVRQIMIKTAALACAPLVSLCYNVIQCPTRGL